MSLRKLLEVHCTELLVLCIDRYKRQSPRLNAEAIAVYIWKFLNSQLSSCYFTSFISFASVSKNAGFSPTVILAIFPSGLTIIFVGKPWTA